MSLIRRTPVVDVAEPVSASRAFWRDALTCGVAIAISLIAAWHVLGYTSVAAGAPIVYNGDALHYQALYQATRENGWSADIDRSGAPFGTSHLDYPNSDALNLLLMRAIGLFTASPFVVFNAYVLLSFALCALVGYGVYRRLGLGLLWALVAALAFTLLPYHFQRVEHAFLLAYFVAAIAGWLALEVVSDAPPRGAARAARWLIVLAAVACSMFGVYYAFFSCLLIFAAGLHATARNEHWRPLARASVIVAIVVAGTAVNLAPSFWQRLSNGANTEVAVRKAGETETYGLKISQLLLPREHHHVHTFAAVRDEYETGSPLSNESKSTALGLVGALGLIVLLAAPFLGRLQRFIPETVVRSAAPVYAGILFATVGAFGALFALLLTPQLRGLNRIGPFIAFFAILAAIGLLSALLEKWKSGHRPLALISVPVLLVVLVLFDQTSASRASIEPGFADTQVRFQSDRQFFKDIESRLGASAMVLELPMLEYPESAPEHELDSNGSLAAFLHTRSTRWSAGAMRGRPEATWQRIVETFPISEQVAAIDALGFAGVSVARRGYPDAGAGIEPALISAGLAPAVESSDTHRVFLAFPAAKNPRYRALAVSPESGWSEVEHLPTQTWIWSSGDATLVLSNTTALPRSCFLDLTVESYAVARTVSMWEGGRKLAEQSLQAGIPMRLSAYLDQAVGARRIELRTDAPPSTPPMDPRQLAFRLVMNKIPLCR